MSAFLKRTLSILVLCLLANLIFVQAQVVSGIVYDIETQTPIPGVNIVELDTENGTTTNVNGGYTIEVTSLEAKLSYSFIGYESQTVLVDNRVLIDINLYEGVALPEMLITALGFEEEERALTTAVSIISMKNKPTIAPGFLDNIAGYAAGLSITQGASGVGSSSLVNIRGESSFTNNNPLIIVDGTPINNNTILNVTNEAAAGFQEVDFGNGAVDINQEDIKSINVLKGPAASALYGTRASNGALIIETKDGSGSRGLGISFSTTTLVEQAFKLPEFQNKYGQGNSGEFEFVDGLGAGINDNITYSWGPELDQGLLVEQFDSPVILSNGNIVRGGDVAVHGGLPITPSPFVSYPDNLKDFYKTGISNFVNFAVSSGYDKGSFRLSYNNLFSESIIPGVNLDRNNVSARFNFKPNEKFLVSASLNYVNTSSDNRPSSGYGSENVNYSLVAWGPRSLNTEALKDYWQPGFEDIQQYSFNYTFFDNPYFILEENRNSFIRDRFFGNVSVKYNLTDNLSFLVRSGMDNSSEKRKFRRAYSTNRFSEGAYAEHSVHYLENNTDFLFNYIREIKELKLDFSFGGNRLDQKASTAQTQTVSLAQPGIYSLSNASSPLEFFQFVSSKRINSLYGFVNLRYKDFLYLKATGRNDWSSALTTPGTTPLTGFFYPSVSAAWLISEQLSLPNCLSLVKLFGSWAQVGNDTDPYQTTTAFVAQTAYNGQPTFSADDLIANANLLPEQTTATELGLDLHFKNQRYKLNVVYYNAITKNQILTLPVPISSGYNEQVVNGGRVRSQGLEISASAYLIEKNANYWKTTLNFALNRTRIEDLPQGVDRLALAYSRVYDNVNQTVWFQVEDGGRVGDMYGTGYLKNENGDFVIDNEGKYMVDNNLIFLGNYNPEFTLSLANSVHHKNWSIDFLLDWQQGGTLVSRTLSLAAVGGQLIETENRPAEGIVAEGVINAGTTENPVWLDNTTAVSAETYYRQFYDRNHEENSTYNASYLKLRQFAISYSFRMNREKGFLQSGRTFDVALIGRNIFAISAIPHFDPEQLAVQGNSFIRGVEDMSYASTRSIGIKLTYKL